MDKFLQKILDERERRFLRQIELINLYKSPLVTFTLNIPGKIKNSNLIKSFFLKTLNVIKEKMLQNNISIIYEEILSGEVGNFSFLVIDFNDVKILKNILIEIEEKLEYGRLLDIDVLDKNAKKISREELNLKSRKCLLCQNTANYCIKNSTHTYEELRKKVMEYINKYK